MIQVIISLDNDEIKNAEASGDKELVNNVSLLMFVFFQLSLFHDSVVHRFVAY